MGGGGGGERKVGRGPVEYGGGLLFYFLIFLCYRYHYYFWMLCYKVSLVININLYAKTNETFFLIFTTRAHIYTFDLDLSPTLCISVNS